MSSADISAVRDWQEIAAELSKETDSGKLLRLAQELGQAFEQRDRKKAAIPGGAENISKRLLLVDDEPGIRATLSIILQQRGFDVSVAANVTEAVRRIQEKTLDLLLSDLNIERPSDGFAVVRAFRQVNPRAAVVILTGYPAFESAVEGIREKVDDYLVKPVDTDLLVTTLERRLMERRSKGSSRSAGQ